MQANTSTKERTNPFLEKPTVFMSLDDTIIKNTPKSKNAKSFDDFVLIPEALGINRKIIISHVDTLEAILNKDIAQVWHEILVIDNTFELSNKNLSKRQFNINKVTYSIEDNNDGTYSFNVDGHIPKYIIIDGQHRFHAFKRKNYAFKFKVLTNLPSELENIVEFVNNFNIGVQGYKASEQIQKATDAGNPLLLAIKSAYKGRKIYYQEDPKMKDSNHVYNLKQTNLTDTPYNSVAMFKKSARTNTPYGKFIKDQFNIKHIDHKAVPHDVIEHIDNVLLVIESVNRLMEGYDPHHTVVYTFISDITSKIDFGYISFADFLQLFENHLQKKIKGKNRKLNNEGDILNRTKLLFGDFTTDMNSFLVSNKKDFPKYVFQKNKYYLYGK